MIDITVENLVRLRRDYEAAVPGYSDDSNELELNRIGALWTEVNDGLVRAGWRTVLNHESTESLELHPPLDCWPDVARQGRALLMARSMNLDIPVALAIMDVVETHGGSLNDFRWPTTENGASEVEARAWELTEYDTLLWQDIEMRRGIPTVFPEPYKTTGDIPF